ncbi:hypothetical protein HDV57DRAFT_25459 [Trichoderma longibrachiatum]
MSVQVGSSRSIDRPTAMSSVSVRLFTPSYSSLHAFTPHTQSTYMTLSPASISHALLVSWPKTPAHYTYQHTYLYKDTQHRECAKEISPPAKTGSLITTGIRPIGTPYPNRQNTPSILPLLAAALTSLYVCVLFAWCCHPRNCIESQMPERAFQTSGKRAAGLRSEWHVLCMHARMLACAFAWACPSDRVTRCTYLMYVQGQGYVCAYFPFYSQLRERNSVLRE